MPDHNRKRPTGFFSQQGTSGSSSYKGLPPPPPPPIPGTFHSEQSYFYNYNNVPQLNGLNHLPSKNLSDLHSHYQDHRSLNPVFHSLEHHSQSTIHRKRPRDDTEKPQWKCSPCKLILESEGALQAHKESHISCTACNFEGAPKVVKGHFQACHGKFSGAGFKQVTIAVPGCPIQRFKICVGNRPEDVQRWIAERKKRFPRRLPCPAEDVFDSRELAQSTSMKGGLGSLLEGYGSSSSEEGAVDESPPGAANAVQSETVEGEIVENESAKLELRHAGNELLDLRKQRPCHHFQRNGRCRNGRQCPYSHDVAVRGRSLKKSKESKNLLEKLLTNDVKREATLTLQILEYLVDTSFLSKPDRKNVG
jgi:hypothetical protein